MSLLTVDSVADYVLKHADQINVFPSDAVLTAEAIQGGNVNFAFCVRSSCGKSVFVKQAPEYVAVFGPNGLPLTSTRIQKEVSILGEWKTILGDEADKYLAKLYYFDDENKVFVMEFLEGFLLLDEHLVCTKLTPNADNQIATQMGTFMAKTHLATHSSKVSADRATYLTAEYENRALRDIQLEFVFTKAYEETSEHTSTGFNVDDQFRSEINALKARYNGETGANNFSLCHGDLHPGSVMVKIDEDDAQIRVIDPEFTVYGPPGLDVGSLLSGFILAAVHHSYSDSDAETKKKAVGSINGGIKSSWDAYKSVLSEGGLSTELIREIEIESVGFAVAEVCRTALGFAGIRLWLQFDDPKVKEAAVQKALSIVQKCMTARHEEGMQV
eukprot:CAMPEP_0113420914 /NCGR_PEP_ID=MMETSP0013_2-20120614/27595_1 /TAXON_ID=2843 ORGANISM="Skeletonema costatum, Strain 1716" /NCGR_SAMPLE_ID=MMETSP0013_2 /ASSEMBLY_ACC=CAM_ASM_000158 /LENGTH=385 /DNA_ID=CAMNT_0000308451 /DNA_START=12 /DNA_END=1165 /DNA_ORIENTATION=+ /assembly_acc=CAM_ASM_000158